VHRLLLPGVQDPFNLPLPSPVRWLQQSRVKRCPVMVLCCKFATCIRMQPSNICCDIRLAVHRLPDTPWAVQYRVTTGLACCAQPCSGHAHHARPTYITLHYITLHYITLHYITLHYITLHYITLHYITCSTQKKSGNPNQEPTRGS
jgi:hypothetical protein